MLEKNKIPPHRCRRSSHFTPLYHHHRHQHRVGLLEGERIAESMGGRKKEKRERQSEEKKNSEKREGRKVSIIFIKCLMLLSTFNWTFPIHSLGCCRVVFNLLLNASRAACCCHVSGSETKARLLQSRHKISNFPSLFHLFHLTHQIIVSN